VDVDLKSYFDTLLSKTILRSVDKEPSYN
jgi:hypothetical protein